MSERACSDLQWRCTNILSSYNEIIEGTLSLTIKSNACETSWGCSVQRYENWWLV